MLKSIKCLLVVTTAIAALTIPAASSARPVRPDPQPYTVSTSASTPATPADHVSAGSAGAFSWHDAAFGAGAMLILVGIGSGAALAVRRRAILG